MKPNFIIAGERRSGTSTLAKWVQVHPEIYLHPVVDRAYFLDDAIRGRYEWLDDKVDPQIWQTNHSKAGYIELFSKSQDDFLAVGEKSADYFYYKPCLERIKNYFPEMKIILTLRNPIERAWSHYWNEVGKGREKLSFEEALEQEDQRISSSDYADVHLSYINRGRYDRSLKNVYELFPKEQVFIIILERLINNPKEELQALYKFLEVDPELGLELLGKRFNHNWTTLPYNFWVRNSALLKGEQFINRIIKKVGNIVFRDSYTQRKYIPTLERITRYKPKDRKMDNTIRKNLATIFAPHVIELNKMTSLYISEWQDF